MNSTDMFIAPLREDILLPENPGEPTRNGFGRGLVRAGKQNENVVALCADLTESTRVGDFKKLFPDRFVEIGVSEQSMASIAAGMASMGKVPFIASYAMFSPGRSWEQVRTTICYNNTNVKVVGAHAGVSVGPDGGTHQAIEDITIMRVIPRMTVITPCDALEAQKATIAAAQHKGPVYLRLAREKTPAITTPDTPFQIGRALPIWRGKNPKVVIFSCGSILGEVFGAFEEIRKRDIPLSLIHMPTVKPIDPNILPFIEEAERVVTIEEHQRIGGLGGAIAEFISEKAPRPVLRIGVDDEFGESGEPEELLKHHGLDSSSIVKKIEAFLKY